MAVQIADVGEIVSAVAVGDIVRGGGAGVPVAVFVDLEVGARVIPFAVDGPVAAVDEADAGAGFDHARKLPGQDFVAGVAGPGADGEVVGRDSVAAGEIVQPAARVPGGEGRRRVRADQPG